MLYNAILPQGRETAEGEEAATTESGEKQTEDAVEKTEGSDKTKEEDNSTAEKK